MVSNLMVVLCGESDAQPVLKRTERSTSKEGARIG